MTTKVGDDLDRLGSRLVADDDQIRQRQACGARLGVPLRTLPLAGANLHPNGASGAHGAPLPFRGSEGARPPASLRRGRTECGPKEYAESPRLKSRQEIT